MKRAFFTLLAWGLISVPLSADAPAAKENSATSPDPATTIEDAKLDAKGRVIFYQRDGRDFALREGQDFGMMIWYWGEGKNPAPPTYQLILQNEKKIIRTDSFAEFEGSLKRIPSKSKVYFINTCCIGTHPGLPDRYLMQVEAAMKKQKLTLTDKDCGICTCPE